MNAFGFLFVQKEVARRTFGGRAAGVMMGCLLAAGFARAAPSAGTVFLRVPFFPDKTDQCGPATLAGVLSFWGKPTQPAQLRNEMYVAKLNGTLPMDLVYAAETRGLATQMVRGDLDSLRAELQAGRPVLAMLDVGYKVMPLHHYVIITGFDDPKGGVYAHSAGKANQFVTYKKFLKQWERTDFWAMYSQIK